jgi:hypothetical protein
VFIFVNFSFALFTPPLGDFQGAGKADVSLEIMHDPRMIRARAHCLLGLVHFNCSLCLAHDETTLRGDWFVAPHKGFRLLVDLGDICPPTEATKAGSIPTLSLSQSVTQTGRGFSLITQVTKTRKDHHTLRCLLLALQST